MPKKKKNKMKYFLHTISKELKRNLRRRFPRYGRYSRSITFCSFFGLTSPKHTIYWCSLKTVNVGFSVFFCNHLYEAYRGNKSIIRKLIFIDDHREALLYRDKCSEEKIVKYCKFKHCSKESFLKMPRKI